MKRKLYFYVIGKSFAVHRFIFWLLNLPPALASGLKNSVAYLVFLSLAALLESSLTDIVVGWKDEVEKGDNRLLKKTEG